MNLQAAVPTAGMFLLTKVLVFLTPLRSLRLWLMLLAAILTRFLPLEKLLIENVSYYCAGVELCSE